MDQKPPRPRTLHISPPANKKSVRPSRHRRQSGRNANELRVLAHNIKEIIHDISFQRPDDGPRDVSRRSYIGISRSSATFNDQPRYSRRNVVSAYYGENRDGSAVTRESGMRMMNRVATSERYDRSSMPDEIAKSSKRQSCPWDLSYFDQHEDRSLQILASELHHLRELREKEVTDLLSHNNKLQHELFDADREISILQQKSTANEKRLHAMLQVYERIRGNLKMCLAKVRDLEILGSKLSTPLNSDDESRSQKNDQVDRVSVSSGFNTMSSDISECLSLGATALGYEGDGEGSVCEKQRNTYMDRNDIAKDLDTVSIDSRSTGPRDSSPPENIQSEMSAKRASSPDRKLLGRLQADIDSLSQVNSDQSQEIERLRVDLTSCRKHVMSSQFQLEAVEIECSRLLTMEDQLVSVITLLKRAKSVHVHRQILGDIIFNAIESASGSDDDSGIPADVFLRNLQDYLSSHPVLSTTKTQDVNKDQPKSRMKCSGSEQEFIISNTGSNGKVINSVSENTDYILNFDKSHTNESLPVSSESEDRVILEEFNKTKIVSKDQCQGSVRGCVNFPRTENTNVLELLKFIDDEEDQGSDTESNRSSKRRLIIE